MSNILNIRIFSLLIIGIYWVISVRIEDYVGSLPGSHKFGKSNECLGLKSENILEYIHLSILTFKYTVRIVFGSQDFELHSKKVAVGSSNSDTPIPWRPRQKSEFLSQYYWILFYLKSCTLYNVQTCTWCFCMSNLALS